MENEIPVETKPKSKKTILVLIIIFTLLILAGVAYLLFYKSEDVSEEEFLSIEELQAITERASKNTENFVPVEELELITASESKKNEDFLSIEELQRITRENQIDTN